MRITKWFDMESQEVSIDIGIADVCEALEEDFSNAAEDSKNRMLLRALNSIATFLKAVPDSQISTLNLAQRSTIEKFLTEQGARFKVPENVS